MVVKSDFDDDATVTLTPGATNEGTIILQEASGETFPSGLTVASGSTFVNTGTVEIDAGSAASLLTGDFNNAGVLDINGASLTLATSATALVNETTGLINAWGTLTDLDSSFTNNGTLSIDTGAAEYLEIIGTYSQSSTGSLNVELGGTSAGTTYDQLAVDGSASLAGTLAVSIINGFSASNGNSFQVLTFASETGSFGTYTGLGLANGLILRPSQTSTALTLAAAALTNVITATAGTPQGATVGTTFATAFQATVHDQFGDPLAGVVVTFAAPGTGARGTFAGNLSSVTATTNALGVASAPAFTAGTKVGSYTVTASVTGAASASYSLTNTVGAAASITATAGTPQSTVVSTPFATAFQALVDDQYGNPISGVVVTFAAPTSGVGGSFVGNKMSVTATTNALGVASAPAFTANTTLGPYTVTASVSGVSTPASYSLTNTVGAAASITATAGTPQSTVVGTPFATAFQALVDDQYGNPIPGVTVTFAAPTSGAGGNFSGSGTITAITNATGVATAPAFTAGTIAGSYSVTATVSGVSPSASFSLTNNNAAAVATTITATAGTPQGATAGTVFATALQAMVADQFGNPIAGVVVTFASPTSGPSGTFSGLRSVTATTNAQGVVVAPAFTAGNLAGSYAVTASVAGVTSAASYALSNKAATATTLSVQPNPVPIGRAATLTASVGVVAPGVSKPTGTVRFYDGSKLLGLATVDASGHAVLSTSNLIPGPHSITATYAGDSSDLASTSAAASIRVGDARPGDYDGDGKADLATFDQTTATFYILYSGGGVRIQQLGNPADVNIPVLGDFDGDGKTDLAVFDQTASLFLVLESGGGVISRQLGNPRDRNIPLAGDFDGDGKTDLAVFDQTASLFLVLESGGGVISRQLGNATHVNLPVAGDFDGDGKTDLAVYDQTSTVFLALESGGGAIVQQLGNITHVNVPLAGDFDGDGKTDLAVFDQTTATFLVLESGGGVIARQLGNAADVNMAVAVDFDGDGKTDLAVYDASATVFLILDSGGGNLVQQLGVQKHRNLPA